MTASDTANGAPDEAAGPARPRDRRATHRAAIEIPAILHLGGRRVDSTIRDLSTRGMALAVKEGLAPGMVVRVAFRLPNARQPVEVSGVLVRQSGAREDSTVGLEFLELEADTLRTVRTFVSRNRSDRPFSSGADGPNARRVEVGERAAVLRGLYKKAVADVVERPGKRGGLLARWLGRR